MDKANGMTITTSTDEKIKSIEFEDEKYPLTHCLFNHVKWRILVESAAFESPACALQFTQ